MKIVKSVVPFVLLLAAMVFMTQFKQLETLTASEETEIDLFTEALAQAELEEETTTKEETLTASAETEVVEPVSMTTAEADQEESFAITSDGTVVRVYNQAGEQIYETSLTDWEQNRTKYYEKYQLGS
ncbi:hypothetical protein [Halobacillus faecis]|uniref:Bypass of forespore C C-terminal domain-containing protein n=1 Tax=Halobacillus faecis TaxID=360184 RepID=A0A511WU18_9BACI|nr:hypothetical protein [Halobacillus faecis]GEN54636.1 hypothetical protein HFA01_28980 [Halobacillus faecis]